MRTTQVQSLVQNGTLRNFPLWQICVTVLPALDAWCRIPWSSDRFVAPQFSGDDMIDPGAANRYDWSAWWTFETLTERVRNGGVSEQCRVLALQQGWSSNATSSDRPVVDQPDFGFRRRLLSAKYQTATDAVE